MKHGARCAPRQQAERQLAAVVAADIAGCPRLMGKPTLRKAAERLATVHTPEGMPLPGNALARRVLIEGAWTN